MLPGVCRTICKILHKLPRLDMNSRYTDPAQHLRSAAIGSIVGDLGDVDYLDRHLSQSVQRVWRSYVQIDGI